jgi:hypothetical protein
MTAVLTYGAAGSDNIILLTGINPNTPVGTQATNPVSVRILAADGVTPVNGATITWSASNSLQLSACGGLSSCSVITDQSGDAATWLTPAARGVATTTATLSYTGKSVIATLNATQSISDIGVLTPYLWIAQGASINIPLTARALSNGTPLSNAKVNFTVVKGNGTLSAASALTNSTGYATLTLSVAQFAGLVQVSACAGPSNAPCQTIYANPVPAAQMQLQSVAGAGQITTGLGFQPVVVRVTDSSSPPNPVLAAPVLFQTTVLRPLGTPPPGGNPVTTIILSVSQNAATTDINGLASLVPATGGFNAPLEVDVAITSGTNAALDDLLEILPGLPATDNSDNGRRSSLRRSHPDIITEPYGRE